MVSKVIRNKIEQKFGQRVRYSKDCDILAQQISDVTNIKISGSTIKRLFGMVKGTKEPRLYTLDVIAAYLGYPSFDDLISEFNTSNSLEDDNAINEVKIEQLSKGEKVLVRYEPDKKLIIECLSNSVFQVLESVNTVLKPLDKIKLNQIVVSYPLFISEVVRHDKNIGKITEAAVSGVTFIERL